MGDLNELARPQGRGWMMGVDCGAVASVKPRRPRPEAVSPQQAAALWHVSERTILRLIHAGRLKATRIGRQAVENCAHRPAPSVVASTCFLRRSFVASACCDAEALLHVHD